MNFFFKHRSNHYFFRQAGLKLLTALMLMTLLACSQQGAPNVSFTNLDGKKLSMAQLKGKVVMVSFWATSCATCVAEMPEMIKIYQKFHTKGLEYVAVAMSYDPPNYVLNFTETRKLPFTVTLDTSGELAGSFGNVKLTPTTFVIDKQGNIIKKYVGAPDYTQLYQLLEKQIGI